jgi:molybdopterin synthase catalytic subunit
LILITQDKLDSERVRQKISKDTNGAVCMFLGTTRSTHRGRDVMYLEYETYYEMAEKKLTDISKDIYDKWQLDDVAYLHRIGRVDIGEISLIVGIAAPHRKEAFLACQYSVDLIKKIVPIWKKEVYVGGEVWIGTPEDIAMRNF